MILIDYSPLLISCGHSANSAVKKDSSLNYKDVHMFRMLNSLRMVRKAYREKYGQVVLAVDRKPYWRSEVFPNYKKNRKPMNIDIDWKTAFANGNELLSVAESIFGYKVIDAVGLEGDDIIGVIVENYPNLNHMVISPDGDFKQLLSYPNVRQYDLIRSREIICKNPAKFLRTKIIQGDKKDGVPNILSDINTFVTEGARQNRLRRGDTESWSCIENPLMFCDEPMLERYEFNKDILDMLNIPQDRKNQIMEMFDNEMPARKRSLYSWFVEKGLTRFIEQVEDFA